MGSKTAHPGTRSPASAPRDGLPSGSQGHPVDLLPEARRNGIRGIVRGLSRFTARVTPIEAAPGRRKPITDGALIEVETEGRPLDVWERQRLLDFAAENLQ
jgi:hypothetical protein